VIKYVIGDATSPCVESGTRVIAHVCNDAGKWGAGFSGAVSGKWPEAKKNYQAKARFTKSFGLGEIYWVFTDLNMAIVNMVAQHGVSRDLLNRRPIRYDSLEVCLDKLAEGVRALSGGGPEKPRETSVHMPRIGCGLAGGTWDIVGGLVEEALWDLDVYIYDRPEK